LGKEISPPRRQQRIYKVFLEKTTEWSKAEVLMAWDSMVWHGLRAPGVVAFEGRITSGGIYASQLAEMTTRVLQLRNDGAHPSSFPIFYF
jgi:hypothetical protein